MSPESHTPLNISSTIYAIDVDAAGGLLAWHPDLAEYLGYQMRDFHGATIFDFVVHRDACVLGRARLDSTCGFGPETVRFRLVDAAGDWHWAETWSSDSQSFIRVLGSCNHARSANMPRVIARAGPPSTPWAVLDDADSGYLLLVYPQGIDAVSFWQQAKRTLPPVHVARMRGWVNGMLNSDVADRVDGASFTVPVVPGLAL